MAYNQIFLTDSNSVTYEDRLTADVALTPGELVEMKNGTEWQPHSSAGDKALPAFVDFNTYLNDGIDTDIAADEQVKVGIAHKGAIVYAFLDGLSGNATAGTSFLESAGNGNLRVHVPQDDTAATGSPTIRVGQIIGVALDSVTAAGTGSRSRIRVRIA